MTLKPDYQRARAICVAVAALTIAPNLSAQSFCLDALNRRPYSEFRNAHERAYLQAPEVRVLLWNAALARTVHLDSINKGFIRNSGDYVLSDGYVSADGIADSLRRRVATDTALAIGISLKLAEVWEAGHAGATEGMAFAAASVYHDWHLPPQAALRTLADPQATPRARAKAVVALESSWSTPVFGEAAAAALCSLAARVAGLTQFHKDTSTSILDPDEQTMFGAIVWALGKALEDGSSVAHDVVARLPSGNLVTRWTREDLGIK